MITTTTIMNTMRTISLGVLLLFSTCTASAPVYAYDPKAPISRDTTRIPFPSEEEINKFFNWPKTDTLHITFDLGQFVMSGVLLAFPDGLTNFNPFTDGPNGIRVLVSTGSRDKDKCIGALIEVESLDPTKQTPMGYTHRALLVRYCDTKKL